MSAFWIAKEVSSCGQERLFLSDCVDAQADFESSVVAHVRKYDFSHFGFKVCVVALDKTFSDNSYNNINKTVAYNNGSDPVAVRLR